MSTLKQRKNTPSSIPSDLPDQSLSPSRKSQTSFLQHPAALPVALLVVTFVIGTFYSLSIFTSSELQFRSRFPSKFIPIPENDSGPIPLLKIGNELFRSQGFWSDKRNYFNKVLVKKCWGWTTLVYVLLIITTYFPSVLSPSSPKQPSLKLPSLVSFVSPWVIATSIWYFLTRWFFGPSLGERFLRLSGAVCVPGASTYELSANTATAKLLTSFDASGSLTLPPELCSPPYLPKPHKDPIIDVQIDNNDVLLLKPFWKGGQDFSGHLFLLSVCILFLVEALHRLPVTPPPFMADSSTSVSTSEDGDSTTVKLASEKTLNTQPPTSLVIQRIVRAVAWVFVVVWWWMFLMTCFYFHSPTEKLEGFVLGLLTWWASWGWLKV